MLFHYIFMNIYNIISINIFNQQKNHTFLRIVLCCFHSITVKTLKILPMQNVYAFNLESVSLN